MRTVTRHLCAATAALVVTGLSMANDQAVRTPASAPAPAAEAAGAHQPDTHP